jgi:hypothetical protein
MDGAYDQFVYEIYESGEYVPFYSNYGISAPNTDAFLKKTRWDRWKNSLRTYEDSYDGIVDEGERLKEFVSAYGSDEHILKSTHFFNAKNTCSPDIKNEWFYNIARGDEPKHIYDLDAPINADCGRKAFVKVWGDRIKSFGVKMSDIIYTKDEEDEKEYYYEANQKEEVIKIFKNQHEQWENQMKKFHDDLKAFWVHYYDEIDEYFQEDDRIIANKKKIVRFSRDDHPSIARELNMITNATSEKHITQMGAVKEGKKKKRMPYGKKKKEEEKKKKEKEDNIKKTEKKMKENAERVIKENEEKKEKKKEEEVKVKKVIKVIKKKKAPIPDEVIADVVADVLVEEMVEKMTEVATEVIEEKRAEVPENPPKKAIKDMTPEEKRAYWREANERRKAKKMAEKQ